MKGIYMAEIKSTLELVLERAARMGRATDDELQQEDERKQGMKMAADFLDGRSDDLMAALAELPAEQQMEIRRGMVETLLRNIFLHRDDTGRERTERAGSGIIALSGNDGELSAVCSEMEHILGQYNQHREQLKQQLEEQIRMQYEQMMAQQQGGAGGDTMAMERTLAAKVGEEWAKVEAELSGQYTQALEQHKATIRVRLK
jgi:hypothetical protein